MSINLVSDVELQQARLSITSHEISKLSYGTVRDYCGSYDLFPKLATYNGDLKDQQRCWMLKSILATVPIGSKIVEIGAGEPIVADILGRLGYSVVVVDPYEGAGNGPIAVEQFKSMYSHVDYIVDWFSTRLKRIGEKSIDCCYSISVLEHIPFDAYPEVAKAVRLFTKPEGKIIHTLDCVTAGAGAEYHAQMIKMVADELLGAQVNTEEMLRKAANDTDTYYLSAEAHNGWRGNTPYDDFPMRKCISVQMAAEA